MAPGHVHPRGGRMPRDAHLSTSCLKALDLGTSNSERRIAVRGRAGNAAGLLWLGGFMSDMRGTKAEALAAWAAQQGRACVRFDYAGHGESSGDFADCTIGGWLEDSLAGFETCCRGPHVVVGSSLGRWVSPPMPRGVSVPA